MNGDKRPLRTNVLVLAGVLAIIAAAAVWASINISSEGVQASLLSIATIATTGLVGYGTNILKIDEQPFDQQEASHKERLREMEGATAVQLRQIELDHEHRNADNEMKKTLVHALARNNKAGDDDGTGA